MVVLKNIKNKHKIEWFKNIFLHSYNTIKKLDLIILMTFKYENHYFKK